MINSDYNISYKLRVSLNNNSEMWTISENIKLIYFLKLIRNIFKNDRKMINKDYLINSVNLWTLTAFPSNWDCVSDLKESSMKYFSKIDLIIIKKNIIRY